MYPDYISDFWLEKFISDAINEDRGNGDHTSLSCIPSGSSGKAQLIVKDSGILAGMTLSKKIFNYLDKEIQFLEIINEGSLIKPKEIAFTVEGKIHTILLAERLLLNCMQRMSGIATVTNKFVKAVEGTSAKILDTRKTTPNFRALEKWAVLLGGGVNHRFGLFDMILIKDNHIDYAGGVSKAIERAISYLKEKKLDLKIEIETRNLQEVEQVLTSGKVNRVMLDNMDNVTMSQAVKMIDGSMETEASGGITLENVRSIAETGVNYISIGALTHSFKSLDLSFKAY